MPADLEVGIKFNTDQAIEDLKNDLEDADFQAATGAQQNGGARTDGGGAGLEAGVAGLEFGSDAATGPGGGGIAGQLAGGISKTVALLGAVVAFLATLEPVQEALSFIARQFELLLVPLVTALLPFLELIQKLAVSVIKFFRNPKDFLTGIFNEIKKAFAPLVNSLISGLNVIPGVDIEPVTTGRSTTRNTGARTTGETQFSPAQEAASFSAAAPANFGFSLGTEIGNYLISDDAKVEKSKNQNNEGGNFLE